MTDNNTESTKSNSLAGDGDWTPCPPGVLSSISLETRQRIRRQEITKMVGIGGSVCALLVAAVLTFQNISQPSAAELPMYGGLACTEVIADMDSFFAQKLEKEREELVRKHLADCPACRSKFEGEASDLGLSPNVLATQLTEGEIGHDQLAEILRQHSLVELLAVLQARSPIALR